MLEIWVKKNKVSLKHMNDDLINLMLEFARMPILFDLTNHGYSVYINSNGNIIHRLCDLNAHRSIAITRGLYVLFLLYFLFVVFPGFRSDMFFFF